MNGVDPAELSALLDGELPPERAAQVRAAIEADPGLRADYERLSRLDAAWSAAAASAAFRPQPRAIGRPSLRFVARAACGLGALLLVRFAPWFAPAPLSPLLATAVLAAVLGWVLLRSMQATAANGDAVAAQS